MARKKEEVGKIHKRRVLKIQFPGMAKPLHVVLRPTPWKKTYKIYAVSWRAVEGEWTAANKLWQNLTRALMPAFAGVFEGTTVIETTSGPLRLPKQDFVIMSAWLFFNYFVEHEKALKEIKKVDDLLKIGEIKTYYDALSKYIREEGKPGATLNLPSELEAYAKDPAKYVLYLMWNLYLTGVIKGAKRRKEDLVKARVEAAPSIISEAHATIVAAKKVKKVEEKVEEVEEDVEELLTI